MQPEDRYRDFLETLTPRSLERLEDHVSPDVHFADPFNDVRGAAAMRRIFRHMFANIPDVRFQVHHLMRQGDVCLMTWRFSGTLRGRDWSFDGSSLVRFAPDGRVAAHIDYWDAARNFYERLPLLGAVLRRLRRRIAVD